MVKKYPTDAADTSNHFKSQTGHFWDPRNKLPYIAKDFFVLHLETLAQDWELMQHKLCKDYSACQKLGRLPHANALRKAKSHNYDIITKDKNLRNLIISRFASDFIFFGYDPMDPNHARSVDN